MFKLFDANNDGVIELDEFKNALPTQHRRTIKEDPGSNKYKRNQSSESNNSYLMELEKQQEADDKKWREIISQICLLYTSDACRRAI